MLGVSLGYGADLTTNGHQGSGRVPGSCGRADVQAQLHASLAPPAGHLYRFLNSFLCSCRPAFLPPAGVQGAARPGAGRRPQGTAHVRRPPIRVCVWEGGEGARVGVRRERVGVYEVCG